MIIKSDNEIEKLRLELLPILQKVYDLKVASAITSDDYCNIDILLHKYLSALLLDTKWFTQIQTIVCDILENPEFSHKIITTAFTKKTIREFLANYYN